MTWESVSDLEFKKKLRHLSSDNGQLEHTQERLVQVLKSPIFLQLVTSQPKHRSSLLRFLETQTFLVGDPVTWTIESGPKFLQWQLCDGISRVDIPYDGYFLHQNLPFGFKLSLTVKGSIDPVSKFLHVNYYERKSGLINSIPIRCCEWTVESIDNCTSRVNLRISTNGTMIFAVDEKKDLLYALKTFASITDMANFQEQKLLEIAKRAEKVRLEQEIVLAEQRIQSLKEQEYRVQESKRRNREQCLECGAPCVQRRRKSDGHLFFGCSKHFTTSCKGAHSIPCPKCGLEMIERRRKEGGTFLGCTGWPGCNGSRTVDARLASERGVGTRKADTRKSYLSREEREEAKAYIDALDEANSHDEEEAWWEEWGDRVHSDDPRETPQYYDHRLLDRWREDPDIP